MNDQPDEPANHTLVILRRLETKIDVLSDKQDEMAKKLDKLTVELLGVKGRVRKVEEAVETIARVMSADASL